MRPALASLAALLLVGCAAPPAAPTAPAQPKPQCEQADEALVASLFDDEHGFVPLRHGAVRSEDAGVYYVAVEATDGGNDVVGIWTTTRLKMPAAVRAVDGVARKFSSYPDGRDNGLSVSDEAARAAQGCIA